MIYFDNAATTFNKPKSVLHSVNECLKKYCANSGRSTYKIAIKTAEKIYEAREIIARLLGIDAAERIVFCQNATHALNLAIKSSVKCGSHVLISDIEHNASFRPIYALEKKGVCEYSVFSTEGDIEENISSLIRENTGYIVSNLASNVTGIEVSLEKLSRAAKRHGLKLIADASQLIGHKELNLKNTPCDVLCAPSHKALFGIQGSGFAAILDDEVREPLLYGGSGNHSLMPNMPEGLPERFEAGTLPSPSIISMLYGIKFIEEIGIKNIEERLGYLEGLLCERLKSFKNVQVYDGANGVISFNVYNVACSDVSEELGRLGICTRSGWHCAPLAHKRIGTESIGTVRVSLSYLNTKREIDAFYKKMKILMRHYK